MGRKLHRQAEDCIFPFPPYISRGMNYGRPHINSLYSIQTVVPTASLGSPPSAMVQRHTEIWILGHQTTLLVTLQSSFKLFLCISCCQCLISMQGFCLLRLRASKALRNYNKAEPKTALNEIGHQASELAQQARITDPFFSQQLMQTLRIIHLFRLSMRALLCSQSQTQGKINSALCQPWSPSE